MPGLAFDADGRQQLVDLSVRALHGGGPLDGLMLIVFREAVAPARRRRSRSAAARELESELQQAREEAQALREEMRASQEELQASNEELQSSTTWRWPRAT